MRARELAVEAGLPSWHEASAASATTVAASTLLPDVEPAAKTPKRFSDALEEPLERFHSHDACSLRKFTTRQAVDGGSDTKETVLPPWMSPPRAPASFNEEEDAAGGPNRAEAHKNLPFRRGSSIDFEGFVVKTDGSGAQDRAAHDARQKARQEAEFYESRALFGLLTGPRARHRPQTGRTNYLRVCLARGIAPLPLLDRLKQVDDVRTGSNKALPPSSPTAAASGDSAGRLQHGVFALDLRKYGLGHGHALALAVFLSTSGVHLKRLNLAENSLADDALAAILKALAGEKLLAYLDVSGNVVGSQTTAALTSVLEEPALRLVILRLEGCNLNSRALKAIGPILERSRHLATLSLARNQLGRDVAALVSLIRQNASLTELDLSYNALTGQQAAAVGEAVGMNCRLTTFNVAFNSFVGAATIKLAASITLNAQLTSLSLSHNGIAEADCLVIAEAVSCRSSFRALDMSGNPVGRHGADALIALVSDGAGVDVSMADCNLEVSDMGRSVESATTPRKGHFNAANPNGFYRLRLSDAYDRSVARQLQRLAYSQSGECWRGERLNGVPFDFPEEDPTAWRLPADGLLELTFVSNRPVKALPMKAVAFERLLGTIVQACLDAGGEPCAQRMVKSLLRSHRLDVVQSWRVLRCFAQPDSRAQVAASLYMAMEDTDAAAEVLKELNQLESSRAVAAIGKFYHVFWSSNPTGHVMLNLGVYGERLAASRLCEINELERRVLRLANKYDVSEDGDWDGFRCVLLNGKPFKIPHGWEVPENGQFHAYYVSPLHAGCGASAHPLTPNQFRNFEDVHVTLTKDAPKAAMGPSEGELRTIFAQLDRDGNRQLAAEELYNELRYLAKPPDLKTLQDFIREVDKDGNGEVGFGEFSAMWALVLRQLRQTERCANLRRLAATTFLTTTQLCQVLSRIESPAERLLLWCSYARRVTDPERLGAALAAMPPDEAAQMAAAFGWLNVINPFQPDGCYRLDLTKYDNRNAAALLVQLAAPALSKKGGAHLSDFFTESTMDGAALAVPDAWKAPKALPSRGMWSFKLRIECRDTETDLPPRAVCREVAETFLGWEFADGDCQTAGEDLLEVAAAAVRRREATLRRVLAEMPLNDGNAASEMLVPRSSPRGG